MANVLCGICKRDVATPNLWNGKEVCERCWKTAPEIVQTRIAAGMSVPKPYIAAEKFTRESAESNRTFEYVKSWFSIGGPGGSISSDGNSVVIKGADLDAIKGIVSPKPETMGLMEFIRQGEKKAAEVGKKKELPPLKPKRRITLE